MAHDTGAICRCVFDHRPKPLEFELHHIWPLAWGGPDVADNRIWICPTTHRNVHELLRAYFRAKGEPPWETRRQFSGYVRGLAVEGWLRYSAS